MKRALALLALGYTALTFAFGTVIGGRISERAHEQVSALTTEHQTLDAQTARTLARCVRAGERAGIALTGVQRARRAMHKPVPIEAEP